MSVEAPVDWYRTSFAENNLALYGVGNGPEKAALAGLEPWFIVVARR